MKAYTIGALFTPDLKKVLLIKKTKPDWQKGKYNLPGGHIERGEFSEECVAREFFEETNLNTYPFSWKYIGKINNDGNYFVDMLTVIYRGDINDVKQNTDEELFWADVDSLPDNVISNLRWLIPFAVNTHKQGNTDALSFGAFEYKNL